MLNIPQSQLKLTVAEQNIIGEIKNLLSEYGLRNFGIVLFGSRAREENREDSDYDFLIVTEENLPVPERRKIKSAIRQRLITIDRIVPIDLLIEYKEEFDFKSRFLGSVAYDAVHEGVLL